MTDAPVPLRDGLPPVLDAATRLVILGSFPGDRSLALGQYYGHPQNHFWRIVGALLGTDLVGVAYPQRLSALRAHGIGLWDAYARCRRAGSLDAAIHDAEPNDLAGVLGRLPALRGIAHNGAESARSLRFTRSLGVPVWRLPSTSPAHASWSPDRKREAWREAFEGCGIAIAPAPAGVAGGSR
jgi:hypoxanthine-DNA glycosylase